MTSARSTAARRPSTLSASISACSSTSGSPSPTALPRRPTLQVKTSLRTALPDRRASAISKPLPRTAVGAGLHTPLSQQRAADSLLYSLQRAPHSAVTVSSIHDHIWRLQERLREMGPAYLSGDSGVPADMYVVGVPLDSFSPTSSSASPSASSSSSSSSSPGSASSDSHARAPSAFCSKRIPATVNIRVLIHPADGSRPKLVCRDFKLSEARSTIPEARRLPSLSAPSTTATAAAAAAEASAARKTLFELGISSPVIGPACTAAAAGDEQLRSPFTYRPAALPMSPFPREPLIGFERRKSLASLGVATPTVSKEMVLPPVPRATGVSRGMSMHLEYARAYLPVLAALMLSGNVAENDRIEICLPYPEAWEATVSHIYTGLPAVNDKIRANSRYLGGKL